MSNLLLCTLRGEKSNIPLAHGRFDESRVKRISE
jgi:hypothetical protein